MEITGSWLNVDGVLVESWIKEEPAVKSPQTSCCTGRRSEPLFRFGVWLKHRGASEYEIREALYQKRSTEGHDVDDCKINAMAKRIAKYRINEQSPQKRRKRYKAEIPMAVRVKIGELLYLGDKYGKTTVPVSAIGEYLHIGVRKLKQVGVVLREALGVKSKPKRVNGKVCKVYDNVPMRIPNEDEREHIEGLWATMGRRDYRRMMLSYVPKYQKMAAVAGRLAFEHRCEAERFERKYGISLAKAVCPKYRTKREKERLAARQHKALTYAVIDANFSNEYTPLKYRLTAISKRGKMRMKVNARKRRYYQEKKETAIQSAACRNGKGSCLASPV
jgi:hypothetical protein